MHNNSRSTKHKNTVMAKYGVEFINQVSEVKEKRKRQKITGERWMKDRRIGSAGGRGSD